MPAPPFLAPMLASLEEPPIAQRGLVYEPKYDGIRAIVSILPAARRGQPPTIAIFSRNGREKHAQFPAIVRALTKAAATFKAPAVLDGEIVAVDPQGKPLGFQHIQGRIHLTSPADIERAESKQPAVLVLFDILRDADEDLRGRPLAERRLRLQARVRLTPALQKWVRLSDIVADDGRKLLAKAREEGWEGLIAKQGDSVYQSGKRTPAWRKLKLLKQQEFVIGGWTEPRQSRQHFGALLVGYYDAEGALRWAGSVGTGFVQGELDRLAALFERRKIATSPFADKFKTVEQAHWIKPDLVAEVRFTEWTSDGLLRQPVYLGTRADKAGTDVRREDASHVAKPVVAAPPKYHRNRREPEPESRSAGLTASAKAAASPPEFQRRRKNRPLHAAGDNDLIGQLLSLERSRKDGDITLPNGETLRVTNLAKVFWPDLRLTKGDLLRYYAEVAPFILPAVDDRPLVMKRFPNGVGASAFYQQRHPDAPPKGVRRVVLPEHVEPTDEEGPRDRLIGGSMTTLMYMAQIAAISQDPWFSRVSDPMHPDYVAIDLDPGDGASFAKVLDVARWVKDVLDHYSIPAWPKTSGASGLHIYIPLPKKTTYETGQLLCQMVATVVANAHPTVATIERMVKRRPRGTVYVDYLQNILGKTIATAYSARASDYAGVSTPLTWKEVARGVDPRDFTIRTAPKRFREVGDLWKEFRTAKAVDIKGLVKRSR